MKRITSRQYKILERIKKHNGIQTKEIKKFLDQTEKISRFTIIRDLDFLLKNNLIIKQGKGQNVKYYKLKKNKILEYYDINRYFKTDPDKRDIKYLHFNFKIFKNIKNLFEQKELKKIKKLNQAYQQRIKKTSKTALKKEIERLTIELSWKSSKLEGNTYNLIDTEILLKENKEKSGYQKEETIMILNHKKAIDYIFAQDKKFKIISLRDVENIHDLIIEKLNISKGIRKRSIGITGTKYKPIDNQYQIKEALEKTIKTINHIKNPVEKAILAVLMISYIQPFEDGNKRTARLLGNAILLAHNYCPLSYRSIDDADYKKAMIIFYEQNSALFFKELFIEQFKFSLDNYFL